MPQQLVAASPGAPGYEAVATCLASPEVRARTEGVIARRPQMALELSHLIKIRGLTKKAETERLLLMVSRRCDLYC